VTRIVIDGDRAAGVEIAGRPGTWAHGGGVQRGRIPDIRRAGGAGTCSENLRRRLDRSRPVTFRVRALRSAARPIRRDGTDARELSSSRRGTTIRPGPTSRRRVPRDWVSVPPWWNPSLAPQGTPPGHRDEPGAGTGRRDMERRSRADYTKLLLDAVEQAFPALKDAFELVDVATPDPLTPLYAQPGGSGLRLGEHLPSPDGQQAPGAPHAPRWAVPVGHWAEEGTSSLRVLTSGRATRGDGGGRPRPPRFRSGLAAVLLTQA